MAQFHIFFVIILNTFRSHQIVLEKLSTIIKNVTHEDICSKVKEIHRALLLANSTP